MNTLFLFNSLLLGVGLAMDAFSVSLANGLNEAKMGKLRMVGISSVYAVFQALMPMLGWVAVHTAVTLFKAFQKYVPFIALLLLGYIGAKMLIDGIKNRTGEEESKPLTFYILILQGVATSIDALSVGFTIPDYGFLRALICAVIIAVVTFVICFLGLAIGKKFGTFLSNKASVMGGIILIAIGLEIFIKGVFGG